MKGISGVAGKIKIEIDQNYNCIPVSEISMVLEEPNYLFQKDDQGKLKNSEVISFSIEKYGLDSLVNFFLKLQAKLNSLEGLAKAMEKPLAAAMWKDLNQTEAEKEQVKEKAKE